MMTVHEALQLVLVALFVAGILEVLALVLEWVEWRKKGPPPPWRNA